jgi:hypothetical protein
VLGQRDKKRGFTPDYNIVIGRKGEVVVRNLNSVNHARGVNDETLGIGLALDYGKEPTAAQQKVLTELFGRMRAAGMPEPAPHDKATREGRWAKAIWSSPATTKVAEAAKSGSAIQVAESVDDSRPAIAQTVAQAMANAAPRAEGDPVAGEEQRDGMPALNAQVAALSALAAARGAIGARAQQPQMYARATSTFGAPQAQSQQVASTAPFSAPPTAAAQSSEVGINPVDRSQAGDGPSLPGGPISDLISSLPGQPNAATDQRGRDAARFGGVPQSARDLTEAAPAPERSTPAPDALGRDADARAGAPQSSVDLTQAAPRSYSEKSRGFSVSPRSAQEVGMQSAPQSRVGSFSAPVSAAGVLAGGMNASRETNVGPLSNADARQSPAATVNKDGLLSITITAADVENANKAKSFNNALEDAVKSGLAGRQATPAAPKSAFGVPEVAATPQTAMNAPVNQSRVSGFAVPGLSSPAQNISGVNVSSYSDLSPAARASVDRARAADAARNAVSRADQQFTTPDMYGGLGFERNNPMGPSPLSAEAMSAPERGQFSMDTPFSAARDIADPFSQNARQMSAMDAMMTAVDPVASVGFNSPQTAAVGSFRGAQEAGLNANAALGPNSVATASVPGGFTSPGQLGPSISNNALQSAALGPNAFGFASGFSDTFGAPASTNFGGTALGSTAGLTGIGGFGSDSFGSGGFGGPDGFGLGSSSLGGTSSGLAGTSLGSFSDFGANSSFGTNNSAFGTSSFGTSSTAGLNANTGANADFGSFGAGFSNSFGGNDSSSGGSGGGIGGGVGGIGGGVGSSSSSSSSGRGSDGGRGSNSGPGSSSGSSVSSSESATSSGHSDAGVGGSECFLTTACTTAAGLPDDCPELRAMRELRDDYIVSFADGRANVREYYKFAPKIVAAVDAREDARAIWHETLRRIREIKKMVDAGKMETAYQHYIRLYYAMKRYVA